MTKSEALSKMREIYDYISNIKLDEQDEWLRYELFTRYESLHSGIQLIKE